MSAIGSVWGNVTWNVNAWAAHTWANLAAGYRVHERSRSHASMIRRSKSLYLVEDRSRPYYDVVDLSDGDP